MPTEFNVGEDVKELVREIISKNNLKEISDIKYQAGSQAGDGYISKTISVDISNENGSFRVFLKCALNIRSTDAVSIAKYYEAEIYFYDTVFPTYLKFLEERSVQNTFLKVPKCYGTSVQNKILALENLKDKGFTLHDRTKVMNGGNVEFVLKTFARFHAVSFAFKDQEREKYQELVQGVGEDVFSKMLEVESVAQILASGINSFADKLDPIKDKYILDKCNGLDRKLISAVTSPRRFLNEYSILTQGDCWCNNMMFIYDNENPGTPIDIRLIDWQVIRAASPVFDIAYFFYTIASEEVLDNLDYHLKTYHEQLSSSIKELGSDPDILYPFHIFEREWEQHGLLYGLGMATILIRIMLSSNDEIVSMEGIDFENVDEVAKMYPKLKNEDEYVRRMKILICHVIKRNCL